MSCIHNRPLYCVLFVFSCRLCSCPCASDSLLCAPVDCNGLCRCAEIFYCRSGAEEVLRKCHGFRVAGCYQPKVELSEKMCVECSTGLFKLIDSGGHGPIHDVIPALGHMTPVELEAARVPRPGLGPYGGCQPMRPDLPLREPDAP